MAAATLARADSPISARSQKALWQIAESDNFRLLNYGLRPAAATTLEECEAIRQKLCRYWTPASPLTGWRPKCDLVLHPDDESYLRAVGTGGRSTVASALVERREGRVVVRRIDVRASRPNWKIDALPHELTHVVIADRFDIQCLPRWIDEGIAIQADPAKKRLGHRQGTATAIARGTSFRLPELCSLADYPPAGRWAEFYDQSATLVDYLVARRSAAAFLDFVELSLKHGYQHAAQAIYQASLTQLEAGWRADLARPAVSAARSNSVDARVAPSKRWINGRAADLATTSS